MKKRLTCLLLSAVCAFSVCAFTACKNNEYDSSKTTVIDVAVHQGGVGYVWLQNAKERFEAAHAEDSYAEGKTGVKIRITPGSTALANQSMSSDIYNIYLVERADTYPFIANNLLLDISEVMQITDSNGKTLEERIHPSLVSSLKGNDGKTYVLPGWSFYSGLSYDKDVFDDLGAYFADPSSSISATPTQYGSMKIVGETNAQKSVGPDGERGTDDDGLPATLHELLVLCGYLSQNSVEPVTMAGKYNSYCKYLLAGLWASLAGYDSMKSVYNFGGEEVEIIETDGDGNLLFYDDPLFPGLKAGAPKKPRTKKVKITEENGYLTDIMAAKYYAAAFLQILEDEDGLFSKDASSEVGHTEAQSNFLRAPYDSTVKNTKGMLMEGSYWWVESEMAGNFDTYNMMTDRDANERNIRWMPLPIQLDGEVTEGNGRKNTLIDTCFSSCYVNNNIKDNPELKTASVDFVKFLYSEQELINFTKDTGSVRPISYEVSSSDYKSLFYRDLAALRDRSDIILFGAENDNAIFRYSRTALKIELGGKRFTANYESVPYDGYLAAYRAGANAQQVIEGSRIDAKEWATYRQTSV